MTPNKTPPPVITLKRPRCPQCRALNKKPYRTNTDGELIEQRRRCETCGLKFVAIWD
jgi:transcriptional regulator NrdR family protein